MAFQDEAMKLGGRLRLGKAKAPLLAGAAAVVVLAVAVLGFGACGPLSSEGFAVAKGDAAQADAAGSAPAVEAAEQPAQVCVYVSGAVAKPDVLFLDEGSRVADAIAAAGGFTDDAAVDALNLARVLNDGEQIAVPAAAASSAVVDGQASSGAASASAAAAAATGAAAGGLVNINSADAAALQTLDGVGEATAKKIIADREANGPFRTIEDLKRVSGIGDKKFANLRDFICV